MVGFIEKQRSLKVKRLRKSNWERVRDVVAPNSPAPSTTSPSGPVSIKNDESVH